MKYQTNLLIIINTFLLQKVPFIFEAIATVMFSGVEINVIFLCKDIMFLRESTQSPDMSLLFYNTLVHFAFHLLMLIVTITVKTYFMLVMPWKAANHVCPTQAHC